MKPSQDAIEAALDYMERAWLKEDRLSEEDTRAVLERAYNVDAPIIRAMERRRLAGVGNDKRVMALSKMIREDERGKTIDRILGSLRRTSANLRKLRTEAGFVGADVLDVVIRTLEVEFGQFYDGYDPEAKWEDA